MSAPLRKDGDPLAKLVAEIADIRRMAQEASSGPFRMPIMNEDPPESDPTNLWLLADGRLRGRHLNTAGTAYVYREWVSTTPGTGSSATAPAAPPTAAVTRQDNFGAIWSHSYQQSGAQRNGSGATRLYYGNSGSDSFNGTNRSLIGFDYAAIAAALAGSTINAVWLTMVNLHTYYHAGGQVYFGIHNFTAKPGTWTGGGIPRQRIVSHKFVEAQTRTVPMPLEFALAIRDGWGKGVAIEPPNSSREFYGYAAGVGSGLTAPFLTINYSK